MDKASMTEYIKVNLPPSEADYLRGNGEGVWVLVDSATKTDYNQDVSGKGYVGILDNDSLYYPELKAGDLLLFEMRGGYRPVAAFYEFLSQLAKLTPENRESLIQQAVEQRLWAEKISNPGYEGPICCDCQYCGDKHSFPEPNDLLEMDSENPLLKHFYCCCGDCDLYEKDITALGIHECECFKEL